MHVNFTNISCKSDIMKMQNYIRLVQFLISRIVGFITDIYLRQLLQTTMQVQQITPSPEELAKCLFKQVLSDTKLQAYTKAPIQSLKQILKQSSRLFHRKLLKKPNQVLAFLGSYHRLIMSYNDKLPNHLINNMSLHFILLSSYSMIENNQKSAAKSLLKKALNYLDSTDPDPILLTTALDNLCVLWMDDGKYYKAVNVLLQVTQIMQAHIKNLKFAKNKSQAMQDSVFLVNTYFLLSKCLLKIKKKNSQAFYKELYSYSSQNGLKKAIKYLGKQSFLTKRFLELTQGDIDIELPIFRREEQQKNTYQQQLLKHLVKIEEMLLSPRQQVVIKQIIQEPAPISQPASSLQSKDLVYQCSRMINNWNVQIQILKQKGQKLGSVVFNCKKGKDTINLIIGQDRLFKLLSQMNIADILPEEFNIANLTPRQFIQYCIFKFVYIDDNRNLEIFPRAHSFLTNLSVSIFGKESIVFLYHIRHRDFRIAFGPTSESQTYHLELELHPQFIQKYLKIRQETDHRIYKIYSNFKALKNQENDMKNIEQTTIGIRDKKQNELNIIVVDILKKLQTFIKILKPDANADNIFKVDLQFLKFIQVSTAVSETTDYSHGRFYFIRYLKGIRGFQVNVENTYQTHSPDGKTKAKGQILYSSYQFFRDFGISSSVGASRFRSFCQILCRKYDIKSYENPLTSRDIQIYQQNSISQVKIAFKAFLRKMVLHKNYIYPITACIISVNNHIPVGIKLTGYNPILCYEVGFFFHIDHEVWRWPEQEKQQPPDYLNYVVEQYGYKKDYFLVEWLERIGFRKIISLLKIDEKDCFYINGLNGNFLRMANALDIII